MKTKITDAERYPTCEPREPGWCSTTELRLRWRYGRERAAAIIDGEDAEAEADIAKWRKLGAGK